jgi:dTDP-6-deoxy-L-talose 4-dehydrogenase (NAD+)
MKVALTGASGFVGSYLIKILLKKKNIEIFNLYRKHKIDNKKVKNIKFDFHKLDDRFYKQIKKIDILIHLAWDNLDDHNSYKHLKTYKNNLSFLKKLISKKIKKIFIMGTCFEYGKRREGLLKENYKTYPSNNYAISKDKLRKSLFHFIKKKTETKIIWGRLFYLFGENQPKKTLYGSLKESIKRKNKKFNMSPGDQKRDYLHVRDVAMYVMLLSLFYKKSAIINICSGKGVKLLNIVKKWKKSLKGQIRLNLGYYNYSNKEPLNFWGSNDKLANFLNSINLKKNK